MVDFYSATHMPAGSNFVAGEEQTQRKQGAKHVIYRNLKDRGNYVDARYYSSTDRFLRDLKELQASSHPYVAKLWLGDQKTSEDRPHPGGSRTHTHQIPAQTIRLLKSAGCGNPNEFTYREVNIPGTTRTQTVYVLGDGRQTRDKNVFLADVRAWEGRMQTRISALRTAFREIAMANGFSFDSEIIERGMHLPEQISRSHGNGIYFLDGQRPTDGRGSFRPCR